ncbi:hypothetical protein ONZ45_g9070 [Pleurotus djamor]|nr:hypothetical protein ONZ45_g9070 [Pleurotus djamor]
MFSKREKDRIHIGRRIPVIQAAPTYYETVFHAEVHFALCCNAHNPRFLLERLQDSAFERLVDTALSRIDEGHHKSRLDSRTDEDFLRKIASNREKRRNADDVERSFLFFKDTSDLDDEYFTRLAPLRSIILHDEEFTSLASDPSNWISHFDVVGQMGLNVWVLDCFEDTRSSFKSTSPPSATDAHKEVLSVLSSDKALTFLYDKLGLEDTPLSGISDGKKPEIFRAALGRYSMKFARECDRMMRGIVGVLVWRFVDYDFE